MSRNQGINQYRLLTEMISRKQVTFTGAAGLGAVGTVALFTVTGRVEYTLVPSCSESLVSAGGGTVEVGIAGNTAAIIAQTTATEIDTGEVWVDNAPATVEATPGKKVIAGGQDIILTVGTADVTDGTLDFDIIWRPLSVDGSVVAA